MTRRILRCSWIGKLIGAAAGAAVGPLGIPFGFVLGALVDTALQERRSRDRIEVFLCSGAADGLSYADMAATGIARIAAEVAAGDPGVRAAAGELVEKRFGGRAHRLVQQLDARLLVTPELPALELVTRELDGRLTADDRVAVWQHFVGYVPGEAVFADLPRLYSGEGRSQEQAPAGGMDIQQACRILGISPRASDAQIKSAYRRLAVQFHPDAAAGFDAIRQQQSSGAFRRIRAAYELLLSSRRSMRAPMDDKRSTRFS